MANNYAGNATNYPAVIRNPSDDEYGNATTLNRPLEDLADRTAFLQASLPSAVELGGPAALSAAAPIPALRHVRGFGWYRYEATYSIGADNPPFAYTSIFGGVWVWSGWDMFTADFTRTKIQPSLIPQALVGWGSRILVSPVSHALATATTEAVYPAASAITGLLPNDTLKLDIGPIPVVATTTSVYLQLKLTTEAGDYYTDEVEIAAGMSIPVSWSLNRLCISSEETCVVQLYGYGNGTVSGAANLQWLRYQIQRPDANL